MAVVINGTTGINSPGGDINSADCVVNGLTVGKGGGAVSLNTATGYRSLYNNTTGNVNTAFGYGSLLNNTTGNYNLAFGVNAGAGAVAGITGSGNLSVGNGTGYALTSGNNNTFVGGGDSGSYAATGGVNTTGAFNTFLGGAVGSANTTGSNNTAVGFLTLQANTTASNNTAVGYQSSYSNLTSTNITTLGYLSGYSNINSNVTYLGASSGYWQTNGANTALGYQSLYGSVGATGAYNVALGMQALYSNTAASNNTAVGYQAGYSNTTGTYNTVLGYQAGYANTTSSFSTYIGQGAGLAATGAGNTFIGSGSGYLITSGAKNSIVGQYNGNQGGLDIRTASNYIVLSDGDGNPRAYWDNNGTMFRVYSYPATGAAWYSNTASSHYAITFNNSNGQVGSITTASSATAYNTSSDYRLKDNIAPMVGALDRVAKLKPVTYNWKIDGSSGEGFVAHELQEVISGCVTGEKDAVDEEGKPVYQGIDTSFLVATLVAAIQELNADLASTKLVLADAITKLEAQALEIATLKGK